MHSVRLYPLPSLCIDSVIVPLNLDDRSVKSRSSPMRPANLFIFLLSLYGSSFGKIAAMASASVERVGIACAKNIAALRLLHRPHYMVSQPFTNPNTDRQHQQPGYTLPFDTEKKLASTLAFLASTVHRPDNVTAICIQENPQIPCLNVLMAINKASATSGTGVMDCIKQKFGDIFSLLADAEGV